MIVTIKLPIVIIIIVYGEVIVTGQFRRFISGALQPRQSV